MTSAERYQKWKTKFTPEQFKAYLSAIYLKHRERRKQAKSESGKRYYAANREKYNLWAKRWVQANPERRRAIKARWRAKHRAEYNAAQKRWRDNNPEKMKEIAHKSYRKHGKARLERVIQRLGMERYNARGAHHAMLRHTRKKMLTIGDLAAIKKIYARCADLRHTGFKGLVVDHIIPISKGGTHEANNLQIIYGFENNRKYNNSGYKPKVVFL